MNSENLRPTDSAWQAIFERYNIYQHNFEIEPFLLTAQQIKDATKHFVVTGQREVRILCKQDTRESRPLENKIKNNSGYSDQLTEIIKNFKEGKYNV